MPIHDHSWSFGAGQIGSVSWTSATHCRATWLERADQLAEKKERRSPMTCSLSKVYLVKSPSPSSKQCHESWWCWCFLNINQACSEIIYAVGKGILEDKILKKLSPSQLSVTVRVQVLVGSSFDPNSGFSHFSPQRFCQGYFSDGSGSRVSLLCSFIMVNSVCVSKMMRHQILLVIYISRSQPWI